MRAVGDEKRRELRDLVGCAETEEAVRAGTLSAVDGTTRILDALKADLRGEPRPS